MNRMLETTTVIVCFFAGGFAASWKWRAEVGLEPPLGQAELDGSPHSREKLKLSKDEILSLIAAGRMSVARDRVRFLLGETNPNEGELISLLVAVAREDGASFDAIFRQLPEALRKKVLKECVQLLRDEPGTLVTLLGESAVIRDYAWQGADNPAMAAIQSSMDHFLDLLDAGKMELPSGASDLLMSNVYFDPATAPRLLNSVVSGELKIKDPKELYNVTKWIKLEDLEHIFSSFGKSNQSTALPDSRRIIEQQIKVDKAFVNFDPSGRSLEGLPEPLVLEGAKSMIQNAGYPEGIEWQGISKELRIPLSETMLLATAQQQGRAGLDAFLRSVDHSSLNADDRDHLLENSSKLLFENGGDISVAVDAANRISNDDLAIKTGEELVVKWVNLDPKGATEYALNLEESPFKQMILEKLKGVAP